jgi:hypothetical protein
VAGFLRNEETVVRKNARNEPILYVLAVMPACHDSERA